MIDQKTKHSAHSPAFDIGLLQNSDGRIMSRKHQKNRPRLFHPWLPEPPLTAAFGTALLFGSHLEQVGAMITKYLGPSSEDPAQMIAIDFPAKREATGATSRWYEFVYCILWSWNRIRKGGRGKGSGWFRAVRSESDSDRRSWEDLTYVWCWRVRPQVQIASS